MEFSPNNDIVRLCVKGIFAEEKGEPDKARTLFRQAWDEANEDLEKFLAAYFIARLEDDPGQKLKWNETALRFALRVNDAATRSALPAIFSNIARCHEDLGHADKARENLDLADSYRGASLDRGPFYHGTKANLQVGDLLTPGGNSNYKDDLVMNHIYFTALSNGAGLAASMAKGEGRERVYIVEPTGPFENDPNLTDKKFPGNLTRSYRSAAPLKIVGELTDWKKQTAEQTREWREKLAKSEGEIIN